MQLAVSYIPQFANSEIGQYAIGLAAFLIAADLLGKFLFPVNRNI